jgi:transposase
MAYICGERFQMNLFPQCIEDYVIQDDPVRAYDAFVESLDIKELGIIWDEEQVGHPEYNPKAMIKLLVYGYSYGIRSSRKLERATYHNLSFIWLIGGLNPDHKTIAEFRKNNKKALKEILKQCARLCIKLELIDGNTLFVDGSKIRANASRNNTWTKEKCEKHLKELDEHIESILKECENIDEKEQNNESLVKLNKELKNKETLKSKVQTLMNELKEEQKQSINSTDKDCVIVRGRQGSHSGYNGQIVVDAKHGLIVNSDVVNENNDCHQFANQIEQANEVIGKNCTTACADSGYAVVDELKKIDNKQITVVVPTTKQASEKQPKPFDKEQFKYDAEHNCYICPEGHTLIYSHFSTTKRHKIYRISKRTICKACQHYKACCNNSRIGKSLMRLLNEETKEKLEKIYSSTQFQQIYKLRKIKVELPFGHIKSNLGVNAFLLRGLDGVKAEMSVLSTCFNIARMIGIFGVPVLIARLTS